jgi:hypothetical protein
MPFGPLSVSHNPLAECPDFQAAALAIAGQACANPVVIFSGHDFPNCTAWYWLTTSRCLRYATNFTVSR